MSTADNILHVSGVVVRFGGLTAVDIEELTVQRGAIVGIIGANGAGKTTLFDVISGFVTPQAGPCASRDSMIFCAAPRRAGRASGSGAASRTRCSSDR